MENVLFGKWLCEQIRVDGVPYYSLKQFVELGLDCPNYRYNQVLTYYRGLELPVHCRVIKHPDKKGKVFDFLSLKYIMERIELKFSKYVKNNEIFTFFRTTLSDPTIGNSTESVRIDVVDIIALTKNMSIPQVDMLIQELENKSTTLKTYEYLREMPHMDSVRGYGEVSGRNAVYTVPHKLFNLIERLNFRCQCGLSFNRHSKIFTVQGKKVGKEYLVCSCGIKTPVKMLLELSLTGKKEESEQTDIQSIKRWYVNQLGYFCDCHILDGNVYNQVYTSNRGRSVTARCPLCKKSKSETIKQIVEEMSK